MKKTLIIFMIVVFVLISNITIVQASTTFGVNLTPSETTVKQGGTLKVVVAVNNISSTDANRGLSAIGAAIEYDTTVFNPLTDDDVDTLVRGWTLPTLNTTDGRITTSTDRAFLTTDSDLFEITFRVKDSAKLGSTTVSLRNIKGTDNKEDIPVADVSCQVQIIDKNTNNGGNNGETPTPTKPVVTASYEKVANGVKVTLTSDKELKATTGWELSTNKKQLSRVYTSNYSGTVTVESTEGVKSDAITINVQVTNETDKPVIDDGGNSGSTTDKTAPTASVKYTKGSNGVTVTITASEQIKPVTGWTLSTDKKTLSRVFGANYTGTVTLEDLAGNKSQAITIKVDTSTSTGQGAGATTGGTTNNGTIKTTETSANEKLPKTGAEIILPFILAIAAVGGFAYFKYRGMKY